MHAEAHKRSLLEVSLVVSDFNKKTEYPTVFLVEFPGIKNS